MKRINCILIILMTLVFQQYAFSAEPKQQGSLYKANAIYENCVISKRRHEQIEVKGEMPEMSLDSMTEELRSGICSGYIGAIVDTVSVAPGFCLPKKAKLQDFVSTFLEFYEANSEYAKYPGFFVVLNSFKGKYSC